MSRFQDPAHGSEARRWRNGASRSSPRPGCSDAAPSRFAAAMPITGLIPDAIKWPDLLTSHISVNFDRTGLQEDWNVAFPLDRLKELAVDRVIGSVADTHYSFMGASDPVQMEPHARALAGKLKQDRVDSVLLAPV